MNADSYGDALDCTLKEITKLHKTIAAQAAVIEKLREALTACVCAMQDHQAGIGITEIFDKSEALGRKILAIPTDSTQILAEVRRAERERCAKVCDMKYEDRAKTGHIREASTARSLAKEIRAMEYLK